MACVGYSGILQTPSHPGEAALSDLQARWVTSWPFWQSLPFASIWDRGPLFPAIAAKLSSCSPYGAMEKLACILPFYHTRCRADGVVRTFSLHLSSLARYCMTCLPRTKPVALFFLLTFAAVITVQCAEICTFLAQATCCILQEVLGTARSETTITALVRHASARSVDDPVGGPATASWTLLGPAGMPCAQRLQFRSCGVSCSGLREHQAIALQSCGLKFLYGVVLRS